MRNGAKARRLWWTIGVVGGLLLPPAALGTPETGPTGASGGEHCHPSAAGRTASRGGDVRAGYVRSERAYAVPDVVLVDDGGRKVRLREVLSADEPIMLNFIFTTCGAICPVMTRIFAKLPQAMGHEAGRIRLFSISIDPEHDTPARLRAYAERFGAGPRWTFLTGSLADVVAVERAFDAFRGDKMNHQPLTLLRPAAGRPWVRLEGFASPAELVQEYERMALR